MKKNNLAKALKQPTFRDKALKHALGDNFHNVKSKQPTLKPRNFIGNAAELIAKPGKRKLLVEFEVDWENYNDANDELLLNDIFINMNTPQAKGISYKIIKDRYVSMTPEDVLRWFESVYGDLPKHIRNQLLINIVNC